MALNKWNTLDTWSDLNSPEQEKLENTCCNPLGYILKCKVLACFHISEAEWSQTPFCKDREREKKEVTGQVCYFTVDILNYTLESHINPNAKIQHVWSTGCNTT